MVHAKRKGNKFELKIYKELQEIIPDIKRGIGSGNTKREPWDLATEQGETVFEVKHRANISMGECEKWVWKLQDANPNKMAVLIYRENRACIMAMIYFKKQYPVYMRYKDFKKLLCEETENDNKKRVYSKINRKENKENKEN